MKRLEADRFVWPWESAVVELMVEQLQGLLAGIDLTANHPLTYSVMHRGVAESTPPATMRASVKEQY
jgi:hypothetical protein